jgi:lipid-A-disaccharide synthase
VIFPFEEKLYRDAGVQAQFVGHPLLDQVPTADPPNGRLVIGFLPGSRRGTVERHLPIFVKTAQYLRTSFPEGDFVLFRPAELPEELYQPYLAGTSWLRLVCDPDFTQRKKVSLAITVSGTASLENTLLGIPMVVMYKLSALTYAIAKRLIRVPYVAIPNILAGKALIPELLQSDATPEKLAAAARRLLDNPSSSQRMRKDLLDLRQQLGTAGSSRRAADEIAQVLA